MRTLSKPPKATPALYAQDGKGMDAVVYAHYFYGRADWYVTEFDPETGLMFGWAELFPGGGELGYTDYADLASASGGLIDYDLYWRRVTLRQAMADRARVMG